MMKNPFHFKKEQAVIIGTLILLWISYQLAFKKTIDVMQSHSQLQATIARASDLSYQPGYLQRKSKNLDGILHHYQMDSLTLRGNTIALISRIADQEHVKLTEVPDPDPLYHNEHFIIQRLDFEGDYFSLTRALKQFEVSDGIGVPRSVTWKSVDKTPGNHASQKLVLQVCFEMSK